MKNVKRKLETQLREQPVWCEQCCIRIAPYDRYVAVGRKLYHPTCYSRWAQAQTAVDDGSNKRKCA